jgi:hypothetical protein
MRGRHEVTCPGGVPAGIENTTLCTSFGRTLLRSRSELSRSTRLLEIQVPVLEQLLFDALPAQASSVIGLDLYLSVAAQVAQVPPRSL